jgi:hypothetical protein
MDAQHDTIGRTDGRTDRRQCFDQTAEQQAIDRHTVAVDIPEALKRKICKQCGRRQVLTAFYKYARSPDGVRSKCKDCTRANQAEYDSANSAKRSVYSKKYRAENAEAITAYEKEYYKTRKEERAEYQRQYREAHLEEIREKDRERYRKSKGTN